MLAKNVNDNACILDDRGVFKFFASKLAPTSGIVKRHLKALGVPEKQSRYEFFGPPTHPHTCRSELAREERQR